MSKPDLLLLDEPLASLDAPFRGLIIQKLKVIFRELEIPMVYVSHSLSEVIALAHQVVVMSEGSVLGSGNVSILLRDSNVKRVADFSSFENLYSLILYKLSKESLLLHILSFVMLQTKNWHMLFYS